MTETGMTLLQGLFLGALQGVAEFLPVSSSGHLLVYRNWFGLGHVPLLFDILLHGATLIAVLIVFRRRVGELLAVLARLLTGRRRPEDAQALGLIGVILTATVFTGLLGAGISKLDMENYPRAASVCFVLTGVILLAARSLKGRFDYGGITWKTGVVTGIAQGLGVFPGISRSGITISASLAAGLDRERAGEYSFLISLPAIAGAMILDMGDAGALAQAVDPLVTAAAFLTSLAVGLFSLLFLLRLVRQGRLFWFSFYLIPFGAVSFFFL